MIGSLEGCSRFSVRIGDLVRRHQLDPAGRDSDKRLGIVMSEVFDMRPTWEAEYPGVDVLTRHQHTGEEGTWTWQLEDIEVVSSVDGSI